MRLRRVKVVQPCRQLATDSLVYFHINIYNSSSSGILNNRHKIIGRKTKNMNLYLQVPKMDLWRGLLK